MPDIIIPPIAPRQSLTLLVEKEIVAFFWEVIFKPIIEILDEVGISTKKLNTKTTAIEEALRTRKVWYSDGVFSGEFNAAISRELRALGATIETGERAFRIQPNKVPFELRTLIAESQNALAQATSRIVQTLGAMAPNIAKASPGLGLDPIAQKMHDDVTQQLKKALDAKDLGVEVDVSGEIGDGLTKGYQENLSKYVTDFASTEVQRLRKVVQAHVLDGVRPNTLAKIIEKEFGVSKRKASFLADQETSLFLSKLRETQARSVGSRRYVWATAGDSAVRHDHARLEGQVFFWDLPPITNLATGARNNPGEDYGCRCRARAIMPALEEAGIIP